MFGGGNAYLELTGEDLLETGVAIMARPPGKKNSTIHLLSGGEKALTAIALVFSIFQLNPAPFCMLDEVDAPLDDANVGRYANLVKEMSTQVQFIYITHNKIAMEMADLTYGRYHARTRMLATGNRGCGSGGSAGRSLKNGLTRIPPRMTKRPCGMALRCIHYALFLE